MDTIIELCFLCTKDYNCVLADHQIVSQVEYLLPEITIIKLGVPLRICSDCDGALCSFSKFKQSSMESSRRLEARIKGAQGPPLHTGSPPIVDDNETSDAKPKMIEEIFIKEECVEETPLDTQMHTNRAFLNPTDLVETIIANADNKAEVFITQEQIEETAQGRDFYKVVLKEECDGSYSMNEDTNRQSEHNTEDESATLDTNEVWDSEVETNENIKNYTECGRNLVQCNLCTKSFQKKNLSRHMKIHSGIKDFKCNVCKKLFVQKMNLEIHMKIHLGIKNFQCNLCKKSYVDQSTLTRHMKHHLGIKNYHCNLCEKLFVEKGALDKHVKFHLGIKDFQCTLCKKSYVQKIDFKKHMNKHSINKSK